MSEKKVIASISGGKDSLAALVTHIESGGRCDGAIYCRIMFDEKISAEYPEDEFHRRRCAFCTRENCDECPNEEERGNPTWWLGLEAKEADNEP